MHVLIAQMAGCLFIWTLEVKRELWTVINLSSDTRYKKREKGGWERERERSMETTDYHTPSSFNSKEIFIQDCMSCFQKETWKSSFLRDVAGGEDVGERTGRKKKESV